MGETITATGESVSISLDTRQCKACGICVARCPTDVFEAASLEDVPTLANVEDCVHCEICELLCPDFALEVSANAA
ncbi:2-oxoglutarate ferredoxin oxidoreductase subunit delta [Halalkaliarchaeum desulfuricum]|uniref:2-oxoglutarate ferredoxin oxidoreductase subunit delta n=1 Tax=Halalkaliarchaeum desulfuricum TaxID=2055893 RepID=A0A343TLS6_9EURY|nr:4Fe-4S binding protein [Halalkaliarchaeum desulfuricum]AUX10048.1 2-oxoglutarate ferredoxin oxidoreductase subunit delta [Halalkaliarchaeum desulfuricum]